MSAIEAFVEMLKKKISDTDMTQKLVGELTGFDPQTIWRIVSGKQNNPGFATVEAICKKFKVDLEGFFRNPLKSKRNELLELLETALPPAELVAATIRAMIKIVKEGDQNGSSDGGEVAEPPATEPKLLE